MKSFESLSLSAKLKEVIKDLGYQTMTPIQEQSLPYLLEGRDLIGQSKTGSGKTAAFTIPVLEKLDRENSDFQRAPKLETLILCPTRELCMQVAREIRKLGKKHIGLQVLPLTGGQPLGPQMFALDKGVHIAVGTPGRVLDLLSKRALDLRGIKTLILDEADRMLDMGFQDEMEEILRDLPDNRHTVLFSATFPPSIDFLSQKYQKDAIRITINDENAPLPNITQQAYEVLPSEGETYEFTDRLKVLLFCLGELSPEACMIFVNFKADAVELSRELTHFGVSAGALHGDLEQPERDSIMAKFRNQSIRVLVATDVAARGIDVESMDAVINFELPQKSDVYVHRIGRTGRAGKSGVAISLYLPHQKIKLETIEKFTNVPIERIEGIDLSDSDLSEIARKLKLEAKMVTLYLSVGRKNKMRPGDILGALTGEAGGLEAKDIGKIEIQDFFSFVAVSKGVAKRALQSLRDGRIKGRKVRVEYAR